jgi:hypothetical protein
MRAPSKMLSTLAVIAVALLSAACVPGPNPLAHAAEHPPAGFLLGLWHGLIIWVSFIVSLFDHHVSVYEVRNAGWTYDLGFVLGAACFHGGGGAGASRRKRARRLDDG